MQLILNRAVKVGGILLPAGADVTSLDKDYLHSIEHQGWITRQQQPTEVKQDQKQVEQKQFHKRKK